MKIKLVKIAIVVSIVMNLMMVGVLAYIAKVDRKIEFTMSQPNVVYLDKSKIVSATQPAEGNAMMAAAVK